MHTVISVFDDRTAAQRALDSLVTEGFDRDDLHIEQNTADTGTTTPTLNSDGTERPDRGSASNFGHFFASLFGQDEPRHSGTYSEAVRRGSSVLVVDARDDAQAERAASLLHSLGAINVDERAQEWRASGWKSGDDDLSTAKEGVMDVVQEELQVGKRSLDKGGVRVIQRVSEKPVRELLKLREERVDVERRAVDRPATQEDLTNFKEGTLEVREMAEEAVVAKSARVVEEVRVGKQVQEREQVIEDTVRRKDVEVERIPGQGTLRETDLERERAVASNPNLNIDRDKPTR
ncbi:YsnF/AvaK domain-containing protein [Ramlibacter sp.]|uniref:YsnF/AvaK domain-containing protein n=1 Tax=Ramlibacter sp. TaxID=1917967 RepID=UPI00183BFB16|nr:YsnF/AvaK domain-containing protein [Ramlibacter sp.]MBA2672696.1 YsnF/AvaK domain-containing protein [Ramlibacter sp.]